MDECVGRVAAAALEAATAVSGFFLSFEKWVFKKVDYQTMDYQNRKVIFKTWLAECHLIKYHPLQK